MINAHNLLIYLSKKYKGNWDKMYSAIRTKETVSEAQTNTATEGLELDSTVIVEDEYPHKFRVITKPPFAIYHLGDLNLLSKKSLAIIGTGDCDSSTEKLIENISQDCIISIGLKSEFDKSIINTLVKNNRKFILVVDNYNDIKENMDLINYVKLNGLLLTEFGFDGFYNSELSIFTRLLVGTSNGIIVANGTKNNDYINDCVSNAINTNLDVFCIPSIESDSITNSLIKEGATLVDCKNDLQCFMN